MNDRVDTKFLFLPSLPPQHGRAGRDASEFVRRRYVAMGNVSWFENDVPKSAASLLSVAQWRAENNASALMGDPRGIRGGGDMLGLVVNSCH